MKIFSLCSLEFWKVSHNNLAVLLFAGQMSIPIFPTFQQSIMSINASNDLVIQELKTQSLCSVCSEII